MKLCSQAFNIEMLLSVAMVTKTKCIHPCGHLLCMGLQADLVHCIYMCENESKTVKECIMIIRPWNLYRGCKIRLVSFIRPPVSGHKRLF